MVNQNLILSYLNQYLKSLLLRIFQLILLQKGRSYTKEEYDLEVVRKAMVQDLMNILCFLNMDLFKAMLR